MDFQKLFLRSLWTRAMLRKIQFTDGYGRLEQLYRLHDPWDMNTAREQHRFVETSAFLKGQTGRVESLLEIGCGEGHQTVTFTEIADRVCGIDVSKRAIARAHQRCPTAKFAVGDIRQLNGRGSAGQYDVVAACEVLYYMQDVPAALVAMERTGHSILVTYVDTHKSMLDPIILTKPAVVTDFISFEETRWTAAFWRV
jgi:2-polyprenyl-3-methyl-5-hydroxy-6-metoxy-1,4-benzoquinol methylase